MADSFATSEDLQSRWPSFPSEQSATADVLLSDASLYLRQQYPGIAGQVATDMDLAQVCQVVVCAMVKRAMSATSSGVAQESTGTGPYSHSVTYSNPSGNLYVTAAEDAFILGYQPGGQTVSSARDVVCGSGYVVTENGAVVELT